MIEAAVALVVLAVVLTLTIQSLRRDARWLGNAYLCGLSVVLLLPFVALNPAIGVVMVLGGVLVLVLAPLAALVLVVFLIANGVRTVRREGRSLAHLLSLLAGVGIAVVMVLAITVLLTGWAAMAPVATFAVLALGYVGAEFVLFLAYSWVYAKIARRTSPSQVVVLGAGLRGGRTVGPLLGSRVDRGIEEYRRGRAEGRETVLIMSGGQGPDEEIPEARAMADYARDRGVPAGHVLEEDRSRTTLENLRFSRELLLAHAAGAPPASGDPGPLVAAPEASSEVAVPEPAAPAAQRPRLPWFAPPLSPTMLVVTSDYHAMRAATHARKVGLPAHAVGAPTARYYWVGAVLREFVAIVNERRVKHAVLLGLVAVPLTLVVTILQL